MNQFSLEKEKWLTAEGSRIKVEQTNKEKENKIL